ncbi:MAG: DsbA family protein [Parcubacteria group bacterium]|jgi:protein-disulfide isomerase
MEEKDTSIKEEKENSQPDTEVNEKKEHGTDEPKKDYKKRMKNYVSIIILLAGLLLGSIFVDVAQFFSKQGFSPRALKNVDVVPFEGKTWVAYNEPVVNVRVLTDSKCAECDPTEPLKWLKRVVPTLLASKVEVDSPEGQAMLSEFKVKSIPAFVFDENVTKTDVYAQAQGIFTKVGDGYLMDTEQVGIKSGKFLETPTVSDDDAQVGPKDAKVKVVLFSDFQCPYCKTFYDTYKQAINEYKDRVLFVFKHVPLDFHKQAMNAAMAGECAQEQGKFWEMSDKLYATQADWGNTDGTAKFKTYAAQLGLNTAKFNQCMDESKYKDQIAADQAQAQEFGISGTPSFFVNDQFFGGVVSYEELKQSIDAQLAN